jgi:hypothetical protein
VSGGAVGLLSGPQDVAFGCGAAVVSKMLTDSKNPVTHWFGVGLTVWQAKRDLERLAAAYRNANRILFGIRRVGVRIEIVVVHA